MTQLYSNGVYVSEHAISRYRQRVLPLDPSIAANDKMLVKDTTIAKRIGKGWQFGDAAEDHFTRLQFWLGRMSKYNGNDPLIVRFHKASCAGIVGKKSDGVTVILTCFAPALPGMSKDETERLMDQRLFRSILLACMQKMKSDERAATKLAVSIHKRMTAEL